MDSESAASSKASHTDLRTRRRKRTLVGIALLLGCYVVLAYVLLPLAWSIYARRHRSFDDDPRVTQTHDGHPGDPLNVALIGAEAELKKIMAAAKWFPADPLGLESDVRIAADTVLKRAYDEAPVSSLYLYGRKEDLAFEQPATDSPRQRHHVRFWQTPHPDQDGQLIWIGSATYDERVGFSETTGQITHHIAADIDLERDHLMGDLDQTGLLSESYSIPTFHKKLTGRNGGGDRWQTNGALKVGVMTSK